MEVSIHYYSGNFTRQQKMGWFWQNFFIAKEHYQGRTETFFCVFQCSNASRYITNSQTTQLSLRGKKGKLLNVKIPNELHSDIPPPLTDEPVKKISDKNGTEHQLKNNHEFIFSCVFQMSIQLKWLLFPEMALGERSRERRKKRKGGKKLSWNWLWEQMLCQLEESQTWVEIALCYIQLHRFFWLEMAPLKDIAIIIGNMLTSASEAQSSQKLKYEKEAVRLHLRI